jgi:D-alanyl-D-alanine carboxypeptidase
VLAGCGGRSAPALETTVPEAPPRAAQVANGPVLANPATSPLSVQLADPSDPVRIDFHKPPRSGLMFDLDTGEVLWRRMATTPRPIASLTKMMTAVLVTERAAPGERFRVAPRARRFTGSGLGVLPKRKRVKVETLLNGMMLVSANDAANALATYVDGSEAAFVERMNARAREMGLSCTQFASPSGIVDAGNHSCAADLAALARAVLDTPRLARIVKRRRAILPFPIKGGRLHMYSTNPLLRRGYPGVIGIKTGYTRAAGRCLVVAARRNGRRLGVVLLHSSDPGEQARKLLDRGFALGV